MKRTNEKGIISYETYTGNLNLSLKFNLARPFELKKEIITYSDLTKELRIPDIFKNIR